jgi:hypothetical protein
MKRHFVHFGVRNSEDYKIIKYIKNGTLELFNFKVRFYRNQKIITLYKLTRKIIHFTTLNCAIFLMSFLELSIYLQWYSFLFLAENWISVNPPPSPSFSTDLNISRRWFWGGGEWGGLGRAPPVTPVATPRRACCHQPKLANNWRHSSRSQSST